MKVVLLYSGGLDSSLVLRILQEWNAEIYPLFMYNQFLSCKNAPELPDLHVLDVSKDFIDIVRNPEHGYGKNLNPCIDCRILMLKKAKEYLKQKKGDFIVTGEVLDQRPMSQHLEQLMLIDKKASCEGLVVRPLSGALLPSTKAETEGLIDRNLLLAIKGRSRKIALSMAEKMNITPFMSPSGGCLLTDPGFCRRLADLMRYKEKIEVRDIELLKIGRHFRLDDETKLIVGRDEEENNTIETMVRAPDYFLYVPDTGSPNALFIGKKKNLERAAAITARYSDKKNDDTVEVYYRLKKIVKAMKVQPTSNEDLATWRI
ncbi:tRNA 4-thiouridine(8) synthase ThiI [candidate division WOR-3 bacterium]|nr:tRNA 4-thiouridine(8) synthase ThiI [candidate division WOR-3 bacterium]